MKIFALKPLVLVLMLFGAASLAPSRAAALDETGELARSCQKLESSTKGRGDSIQIPGTRDALLCWGYMRAIQDIAMLVDPEGRRLIGACPPEDSRLTDLIHAFVEYARSHRRAGDENTALAVIGALRQAYPCGDDGRAKP